MSGPHIDQSGAEHDDSALLESQERQLHLWRMTMHARYVALVAVALVATLPVAGPHRFAIVAALLLVMMPYNWFYDRAMRRKNHLSLLLAFSDQVFAVAFVAFAPELVSPILIVMLALNATSAVAFGRRAAGEAAVVGCVGVAGVLSVVPTAHGWAPFLIYVLASAFLIVVVGGIAEIEREVRGRYVELMGGIDAVVWEQLSHSPTRLYVNRRAEELLGHPASEWAQPGFWHRNVHPDDREWVAARYTEAVKAGEGCEVEYRFVLPDGEVVWLQDRIRVETDGNGQPTSVRGVMVDVTGRRRAEEQMEQYLNLVEHLELALFVFALEDPDDHESLRMVAINPEARGLMDRPAEECLGQPLSVFTGHLGLPDQERILRSFAKVSRTGKGFHVEDIDIELGRSREKTFAAKVFPLPGGSVGMSLQDVTERVTAAAVLRRQAEHDALTGLPNRSLLNDRLREALRHSSHTLEPVALIVMDLDQFKEINDALGHDHGDRLLIELSRRLPEVLVGADTVARLGGDEFAVLLTEGADLESAKEVAGAILRALERPFQMGGISLQINASVGIAVYPEHAVDTETLARRADVAMYTAKRSGSGFAVYAPEHDQSSIRRLSLLGELRRAISENELVLHFQPSIDLATGEVRAAEALVRWQHPVHGLLPPSEFIELAEVSGSIQALTRRWVLEESAATLNRWHAEGITLPIAVNLSVRNLYDIDLPVWLDQMLALEGIDPALLILEITESELMDDPPYAMEVLGKLKALGVATSIDDFGTGYSSLAYLKNLPIDELKIDRSFVATMMAEESDLTIVRSIIDLSHNLGLSVVAEGVEDAATLAQLTQLGCDRAQGHYLSRPVPADALVQWLRARDGGCCAPDDPRGSGR